MFKCQPYRFIEYHLKKVCGNFDPVNKTALVFRFLPAGGRSFLKAD
jgi:hypothetical protein